MLRLSGRVAAPLFQQTRWQDALVDVIALVVVAMGCPSCPVGLKNIQTYSKMITEVPGVTMVAAFLAIFVTGGIIMSSACFVHALHLFCCV